MTDMRERLLFSLLGLLVAGALAVIVRRPDAQELLADGYVYLLMADALRVGDVANPPATFLFSHFPFPPLFPALLAVLGAGADAFERVLTVNAVLLGLACTLAGLWFRTLGIPVGSALALALVYALLPVTYATAIDVQSEPLYLALTLASLVFAGSARTSSRWLLAALCAGLAVLARTAGIALLGAFTVVWLLQGRRRNVMPLVLAWLPFLAWQVFRRAFDLEGTYFKFSPFPPGEVLPSVLAQIGVNLQALAQAVPRSVDFANHQYVVVCVAALGLLAAGGFVQRLQRLELDALYVAGYLGLMLIWPYPLHMRRFLYVILPLAAGYAMLTFDGVLVHLRVAWSRRLNYVVPILLLILAFPSLAGIAYAFSTTASPVARATVHSPARYVNDSPAQVVRQRDAFAPVVRLLDRARVALPPSACISSAVPELTMFHARRPSRPLALTGNAPRLLLKECPYVLMVAFRSIPDNGLPPLFPYHQLRAELQILDVAESDPQQGKRVVRALLAIHRAPSKP